jgi:hypothetical protein
MEPPLSENSRVISELTQSLGISCESESQIATMANNILAYCSGPLIIIYDLLQQQQVKYVSHRTHLISAIAVS